jgi:phage terminase large subunit
VTAATLQRQLVHEYSPRGSAVTLLESRDDEVLLSGPAGTGKSRACLEKLNLLALKYPGMKALIARKSAKSLTSSALDLWENTVVPELIESGYVRFKGSTEREPARYRYKNKSTVAVCGMDNQIKIMSTDFDIVFVQEAIELAATDWGALTSRLRHGKMPYQQMIADTNPTAPVHWLKKRADSKVTKLLYSRHEDNPRYFDGQGRVTEEGAAYLAKLDNLPGIQRMRLKDGLWVAAEGVIWGTFIPATHVVPRFEIPDSWERVWSVDFGTVHPFVLQCWAIDGDGRGYLYREIYFTGRMVEDYAKQVLAIVAPDGKWTEPKPSRIVCDHQAQERLSLKKYLGLSNVPADKRVKLGLDAVEKRFKDNRLFILEDSLVEVDPKLAEIPGMPVQTTDEIPLYVWDEKKEQPVKERDDGCDALRYFVASQDLKKRLTVPDDREVWV